MSDQRDAIWAAAETYAAAGWTPVPSQGKAAMHGPALNEWRPLLRAALAGGGPVNLGAHSGHGPGFLVVDVDVKDGGVAAWREIMALHGPLVGYPHVTFTGRRGYHYFFRNTKPGDDMPRAIRGVVWRGTRVGIDLLSEGQFVVLPPSVGTEVPYVWSAGSAPDLTALPVMPEWLRALFDRSGAVRGRGVTSDCGYPRRRDE